jgi:nicotinate-nucleotide adenylyltransferase
MRERRLGILGGTFDPVHVGHMEVGDAACKALGLTEMVLVTSNVPPHRPQPLTSAYHRFAMVAMAVQGRPDWRAADLELRYATPSYTSRTLDRFHDRGYQAAELFFVIGADAFVEIESWRDYPTILEAAHFAVVSRPGWSIARVSERLPHLTSRMVTQPAEARSSSIPLIILIDAPTSDVSSTAIRERLAAGDSIAGMVPAGVQQHIEQHGLYTSTTRGRRAADAQQGSPAGRLHGQE